MPTALLGGGALAGLLLSLLAGFAVRAGARRRARKAERALSRRVEAVGERAVVAPVEEELAAQQRLREALAIAGGRPGTPSRTHSFVINSARRIRPEVHKNCADAARQSAAHDQG